ncbi:MAG: tetratricopeptide repeat protein [Bacteroidota bacterium]
MMRLKILTPVLFISALLSTSCTQTESMEVMPITTDSELALEFYETGVLAFDQVKLSLAWHNFEMAVKEDPGFFMANLWMYFISSKGSKEVAEKVLQSDASLNEAEKQIKSAFKYLLDGQHEKVVEHLQLAIDLYPSDPHVHKILYVIQFHFLKDYETAVKTIHRAIEERPDYALAYNMLGYAHMDLEEYDKAEEAFDTYIKKAPAIANPYDSKGDYYMTTEQFDKAYESYMKAFEIDSGFVVSKKKALKAKQLLEKLDQ